MTDGRNIDPSLGLLLGEGAQMQVLKAPFAPMYSVIKESPWSWDVPAYYYVGGTTGGLMTLSAAAALRNHQPLARMIQRSRLLATGGALISSYLLIHDLGRPSRFIYMLRVFRPTSPMSVGSWLLTAFSTATGLSALTRNDSFGVIGGILGLALSGYAGVLVSNTVVPIWKQPHRLMPLLFLSSGASGAASILDLFPSTDAEHRVATSYGIAGKTVELVTAVLVEREVDTVPEVSRPLYEGISGSLWQAGKILTAVSLVLSLVPKPSRTVRFATGIFGTAGAIAMRFGIHYAGQISAEDSQATFRQQQLH
jgi:formate-dependent nitrite reductase membrane component NrfD